MYLIFVDECGYQKNWPDEQAARDQPFHVVSGVVVRSSHLSAIYTSIRSAVAQLGLPETEPEALGKGQEIKASWIDKGQGFWRENPFLRGKVREIYLNLDQDKVTYFLVCIDKKAHMEHYAVPKDPSKLALQYLLERLQKFLQEMGDNGYVLIDLNRGQETEQREFLAELHRDGSSGIVMGFYGDIYEWKLEMNNIVEIHFGDSRYSLGLQVADFVARHAYSWRKNNRDSKYPGWCFIEPRLYNYPNYQGRGYKEFP